MARIFGRILSRIWDDEDFLALEPAEQRLYMFLFSQRNLNHAGLLPLTLRRWAGKAKGLDVCALQEQLEALRVARFVVLDYDTEELLIRSFVRSDEVYKQPRVMGAMVSGAREIASPRLRWALLAEVERIPLEELSEEPGAKGAPSIRTQVLGHIADLRAAFGPMQPPPEPPAEPLPKPLPEGDDEEDPQGSTRVHASPRARALPLPLEPSPTTNPLSSRRGSAEVSTAAADEPRADVEALCTRLAELMVANGCKPPTISKEWRDSARLLLDKDGREFDKALRLLEWSQASEFWRSNILSLPKFRKQYEQLRLQALADWERGHPGATVLPFRRPAADDYGSPAHMQRFIDRETAREQAAGAWT
jgi:hypothetical protein